MHHVWKRLAIAAASLTAACDNSVTNSTAPLSPSSPTFAKTTSAVTSSWKLPLADSGLGLVSDRQQSDGTFSVYEDGVCGVTGTIFTNGSGDATLQTNNPKAKTRDCPIRTMTLVYPTNDAVYPDGGTETMPVFLNLHDISSSTTTIPIGSRVQRQLSLNPTQTLRCDAWRWTDTTVPGDKVWVERINSTTYHVYTKDRDPDPIAASLNVDNNKAVCTTTGQIHHLSVDLHVVAKQTLP